MPIAIPRSSWFAENQPPPQRGDGSGIYRPYARSQDGGGDPGTGTGVPRPGTGTAPPAAANDGSTISLYDAVARFYQTMLGRAGSAAEINRWISDTHGDLGKIQTGIFNSAEGKAYAASRGQPALSTSMKAADFIKTWQGSHDARQGLGSLVADMKQAGYNVAPYMYGTTASNNEISLDGSKYKVLSGEGTPGAAWYTAGQGDGSGGPPPGVDPSQFGSLLMPWTRLFNYDKFKAPTSVTESNDPGVAFRFEQGQKGIERSAAARGTLLSGGTLKDLASYQQGLASDEYANVWNRAYTDWGAGYNKALGEYQQDYNIFNANQDRPFNKLSALSGMGQVATNQLNSAGNVFSGNVGNTLGGTANSMGNFFTQGANATAAGQVGAANAWSGAFNNIGNTAALLAFLNRQSSNPR